MSEYDFQLKVMEALGSLQTDVTTVKENLRSLNDRVLNHEKELAERRHNCPLVDEMGNRIRPIEDFVVGERAAEKTTRSWMDHAVPILRYAVGVLLAVIVTLALNHANLFSVTKPDAAPAAVVGQKP